MALESWISMETHLPNEKVNNKRQIFFQKKKKQKQEEAVCPPILHNSHSCVRRLASFRMQLHHSFFRICPRKMLRHAGFPWETATQCSIAEKWVEKGDFLRAKFFKACFNLNYLIPEFRANFLCLLHSTQAMICSLDYSTGSPGLNHSLFNEQSNI